MHRPSSIRPISDIFQGQRIDLPQRPGVYAFWWLGDKQELMNSNRHIVLKGPNEQPVNVELKDWWPKELEYPCLYVGKSTNIKNRFSLHIMRGSKGRVHQPLPGNRKASPRTTSCQLRFGIEHVFPSEENPLSLIYRAVGFSYNTHFSDNAIAERFYEEDRLVGVWRPWFNVDSER